MRVSLAKTDRNFSVAPDQPVLEAALAAGLNLPHRCKSGNCGACRAFLVTGEIQYPFGTPLGLSGQEGAGSSILLCQARARSDLTIDLRELQTADAAASKRVPARIARVERVSHDVLALFLRLPPVEPMLFKAGQYIDILLSGGRRRSFSIASPPHDSGLLELHVRLVPGGELTERLFAGDAHAMLLSIEGPLGGFVYQPDSHAPLLLLGGGTGIAPLKSIWRHVIENGSTREIVLYWGARRERDLYANAELMDLAARAPHFRYVSVLSEPDEGWAGRRGWVHAAVLRDYDDLSSFDVYASGPPAMIAAIQREFPARGACAQRLFFDSFDYAADTLERQRTMASTKA